jgi:hypothetical protein
MPPPRPDVGLEPSIDTIRSYERVIERCRVEQRHVSPLPELRAGRMRRIADDRPSPSGRQIERVMAVTRQRELVETVDLARERHSDHSRTTLAFKASRPVALTCPASAGFKLQKNAALFSAPGSGLPIGSTLIITLALS